VSEATEYETPERLLVYLKIRLGRFDLMRLPGKRQPVPIPQSISFQAMKQDEFGRFFQESVQVIFSEILPAECEDEIMAECESLLGAEPRDAFA
jgi:hypothetical protein